MLAPINYMLENKSPMDSFFGGMQSVQGIQQNNNTLRQQELVNEQQAAAQARKAQMEAELDQLDTTSIEAMRAFNAKYPDMAKGVQQAYDALDAKQKQNTLLNHSRIASLVKNGRPESAVDMLNSQVEAYRNAGDEQGAQEAQSMADMIKMSPEAGLAALTWGLSIMSPKDVAENYASLSGANIAEDDAPVNREATQAKTVNERVAAAGGVNKLISTAALTDDPNTFMEMIDTAYDAGLIAPEKYNSLIESVSGDGEEAVATLRRLARGNPDIIDKLLPDVKYNDLGDGVAINSYNPQTGEVQTLGTMEKGINPETIYKENAATDRNTYSQDSATNRTAYTVDQQAETARQSRELQAYLAEQKAQLSSNEFTQKVMPDGRVLLFNKQGQWKPVLDTNGKPMISKPSLADKPLNESQGNSLMYGKRMQTANKILENLESTNGTWDIKGGDVLARINPKGGSEDFKKYEQAKRNFINAILRKESGAAIGQDEFESADKQYFPQIGDTEAVIKQKAANRRQVTSTMLSNVGPKGEAAKKTKPVKTDDLF